MYRFILIFVAVVFVVAIGWVSYIKYGEFQNQRAAASWEKYGDKPEAPEAASMPASAPASGSAGSASQAQ